MASTWPYFLLGHIYLVVHTWLLLLGHYYLAACTRLSSVGHLLLTDPYIVTSTWMAPIPDCLYVIISTWFLLLADIYFAICSSSSWRPRTWRLLRYPSSSAFPLVLGQFYLAASTWQSLLGHFYLPVSTVERSSSVVECRTRNRESPVRIPLCYRFEDWAFFVHFTDAPVHSAV